MRLKQLVHPVFSVTFRAIFVLCHDMHELTARTPARMRTHVKSCGIMEHACTLAHTLAHSLARTAHAFAYVHALARLRAHLS